MNYIKFKIVVNETDNSNKSITLYSCNDHSSYHVLPKKWVPLFQEGADTLCVTNGHWLNFDPPTPFQFMILLIIYSLLMITGCIGNFLVVYFVLSSRALRTTSNFFVLNLAVSDFLMVLKICILNYNLIKQAPSTGRFGCNMFGFLGGLTGTTSIMTLAAIAIDRYLVIAHPLDPFKKFSYRQVAGIIALIWLYSLAFSIIPLLGIDGIHYSPEGFLVSCSFDYLSDASRTKIFILCFFVAAFVLPLSLITFSYITIVVTVRKQKELYKFGDIKEPKRKKMSFSGKGVKSLRKLSRKKGNERKLSSTNSFKNQYSQAKLNTEMKLARVACCIICLWVIAWTPYSIVALLGISGKKYLISPLASMIPAILCKTSACVDPFVYALSHPRFKKEIDKRILDPLRYCFGLGQNKRFDKCNKKSLDGESLFITEIGDRKDSCVYKTQKSFDSGDVIIMTGSSSASKFVRYFAATRETTSKIKASLKTRSKSLRRGSSLSSVYELEEKRVLQRSHSIMSSKFMETELNIGSKLQI